MTNDNGWPREYLGDGVYASFDGFHIWLHTSNGVVETNRIALEQAVYGSLVRYATRLYHCCEFRPGDRVRFVPLHALEDVDHEDCQDGWVSSQNGVFVFVRFSGDTSHACDPTRLIKLTESITCPKCRRTSYHPKDVEHRYCANCKEFRS